MRGFVRNLYTAKRFGFIKVDKKRKDYFFHQSDCRDWDTMVDMYGNQEKINVDFEPTDGAKGPRAANVLIAESE